MSNLIVVAYDDPFRAEEVRTKLRKLQQDYLIDLEDAVVAVKDGNGKVKLTDDRFEPLVEESLCPQQNALEFRFKAEGGPHFLTIKAPVVVDTLLLKAVTQP